MELRLLEVSLVSDINALKRRLVELETQVLSINQSINKVCTGIFRTGAVFGFLHFTSLVVSLRHGNVLLCLLR